MSHKQQECIDQSSGQLEDCLFLDYLYQKENLPEETDELVATKIFEIEREVGRLSSELNEAYIVALVQEVKQKTHYVRNKEFLLMFLRCEMFDATKAAVRLANFFTYKLDLFGAEKLPRPIYKDDLNEDDRKVLASGSPHFGGLDCGGRRVVVYNPGRLEALGLLNAHFMKSILRVAFFKTMHFMEADEQCQKTGFVTIRPFNSNLSLKDYRFLFSKNIKLYHTALPGRLVAGHDLCTSAASKCLGWALSIAPSKHKKKLFVHSASSTEECLLEISRFGIDVDSLPIGNVPTPTSEKLDEMHVDIDDDFAVNAFKGSEAEQIKYKEADSPSSAQPNYLNQLSAEVNTKKASAWHDNISEEFLPVKLMKLLESNRFPGPLWWSSSGSSFKIQKKMFSKCVLPNDFDGINFNSFLRKLRDCGFRRVPTNGGSGILEYRHRLFQRNSPQLLKDWKSGEEDQQKKEKLPMTLMRILQKNEDESAIWWVCDGKAFAIETANFSSGVLKNYFKGVKLDSFYRMLSRWGFKRLFHEEKSMKAKKNLRIYQHTLFQKNSQLLPDLLEHWTYLDGVAQSSTKSGEAFLKKLQSILESNKYQNAIWWEETGDAFSIETNIFAHDVLAQEYNGISFYSFRRSLKRWGFEKVKTNGPVTIFQHLYFQKN